MKNLSNLSGMPQMGRAFAGWTQKITLTHRIQNIVEGLVNYANYNFTFSGTIQPLSPKQIALKPEGQRAWEWLQIHCQANQQNKFMQIVSSNWDVPGQIFDTDNQTYDAPPAFIPGAEYADILKVNDQIVINGKIYKIMGKLDYSRNGFIEYHLVKDYQP